MLDILRIRQPTFILPYLIVAINIERSFSLVGIDSFDFCKRKGTGANISADESNGDDDNICRKDLDAIVVLFWMISVAVVSLGNIKAGGIRLSTA